MKSSGVVMICTTMHLLTHVQFCCNFCNLLLCIGANFICVVFFLLLVFLFALICLAVHFVCACFHAFEHITLHRAEIKVMHAMFFFSTRQMQCDGVNWIHREPLCFVCFVLGMCLQTYPSASDVNDSLNIIHTMIMSDEWSSVFEGTQFTYIYRTAEYFFSFWFFFGQKNCTD